MSRPPAVKLAGRSRSGTRRAVSRLAGPAGSLLLVEEAPAIPLVHIVVAARTGAASDPLRQAGLANLSAEWARCGGGRRGRQALDQMLDGLGATLNVLVDQDSVRWVGSVLAPFLPTYLALLADVIVRPRFEPEELARTRREILGQIDDMRSDDRALATRFFARQLYGDRPYGRAVDGTARSLAAIHRAEATTDFSRRFVGSNLIFAVAGPVTASRLERDLGRLFRSLPVGPAPVSPRFPASVPQPHSRLLIVNKPDRQQTQIMFGHPAIPAHHPDFLALELAMAAFGGSAMRATLMDEVRTRRGLAYGAYMNVQGRRGAGTLRGWMSTATENLATALKLVQRLYRRLHGDGLTAARLRFFKNHLAGTTSSDLDGPHHLLGARVAAELQGLPPDSVDTYIARLRALPLREVNRCLAEHLHPRRVAVTLVTTASEALPLLAQAGLHPDRGRVVRYDKD